jgi:hypothetical protein
MVAIARLEIVAPQQMDLGTAVPLIANAVKSDGSVENVTTRARWTVQSSSTGAVLSLTAMTLPEPAPFSSSISCADEAV